MKGDLYMSKVKWLEETCNNCGSQINSWDKRISKTLAYRYPNCEKCIAEEYDMKVGCGKLRRLNQQYRILHF